MHETDILITEQVTKGPLERVNTCQQQGSRMFDQWVPEGCFLLTAKANAVQLGMV